MAEELDARDYVALVRLSNRENNTIALPGETCERVLASPHGGTVSDAIRKLLRSGVVAYQPRPGREAAPAAPETAIEPEPEE